VGVGKSVKYGAMFKQASSFNQDIGGWNTTKVNEVLKYGINGWSNMFNSATEFNANCAAVASTVLLGWDKSPGHGSSNDACKALTTTCTTDGNNDGICDTPSGRATLQSAVDSWITDAAAAATPAPCKDSAKAGTCSKPVCWAEWDDECDYGLTSKEVCEADGTLTHGNGVWCEAITGTAAANFGDIADWDVGEVTSMNPQGQFNTGLFYGLGSFNENIGGWDTASVTSMASMFDGASSFNQNIGSWNTGAVTTMASMFHSASSFNHSIGSWNTGKVSNMFQTFVGATVFVTHQTVKNWDMSSVTDASCLFENSHQGTHGDYYYDGEMNMAIGEWELGAVGNMESMFKGAKKFAQPLDESVHYIWESTCKRNGVDEAACQAQHSYMRCYWGTPELPITGAWDGGFLVLGETEFCASDSFSTGETAQTQTQVLLRAGEECELLEGNTFLTREALYDSMIWNIASASTSDFAICTSQVFTATQYEAAAVVPFTCCLRPGTQYSLTCETDGWGRAGWRGGHLELAGRSYCGHFRAKYSESHFFTTPTTVRPTTSGVTFGPTQAPTVFVSCPAGTSAVNISVIPSRWKKTSDYSWTIHALPLPADGSSTPPLCFGPPLGEVYDDYSYSDGDDRFRFRVLFFIV